MPSSPSRRDLLRAAAGACGIAATAPILSACGGDSSASTDSSTGRQGGTLRAALVGGPAETLNPYDGASPMDFARNRVIYDVLFALVNGASAARLAKAATPAPDGKSFQLQVRGDVRWQDGSPFTAKDVAYSLRYSTDPKRAYPSTLAAYVDAANIKVVGDDQLEVPLRQPIGDPATLLAVAQLFIVKDGTTSFNVDEVVGTGPFQVKSFAAGRTSTLRRFADHWDGAPALDELTFLSLNEPQARVNAVLSGEADFAAAIPYTTAKTVEKGRGISVQPAGPADRTGYGFILNTSRPPFNDPRARRAIRLAVDRRGLVDTVFLGYGVVGNDLYGAGARYYASDIAPPQRDLAEARRLLDEAGAAGATIVVRSAENDAGNNGSAQVLAEQMKEIGLTVQPQIVTTTQLADLQAMARANAVTLSLGAYPLQTIYLRQQLVPALAFNDPELKKAQATAMAAPAESARAQAWRTVQQIMADRGNTVVWGFGDTLSLVRDTVKDVEPWGFAKYPYLGKAALT